MKVATIPLAPTVKSNWPAMNGISAPSAAIVTTAWFSSVARMFADVRKVPEVFDQTAKKTISAIRKITRPYCSRIVDTEGRGRLGSPAAIDLRLGAAVSGSCCSVVIVDSPGDSRDQTPAVPANGGPPDRGLPTPRRVPRAGREPGLTTRGARRRPSSRRSRRTRASAAARTCRWISARAPTSTPWVGSSSSRRRGWPVSQRARTTFC